MKLSKILNPFQERNIEGNKQVRFNPFNPLSYIIFIMLFICGLCILGFKETWRKTKYSYFIWK